MTDETTRNVNGKASKKIPRKKVLWNTCGRNTGGIVLKIHKGISGEISDGFSVEFLDLLLLESLKNKYSNKRFIDAVICRQICKKILDKFLQELMKRQPNEIPAEISDGIPGRITRIPGRNCWGNPCNLIFGWISQGNHWRLSREIVEKNFWKKSLRYNEDFRKDTMRKFVN